MYYQKYRIIIPFLALPLALYFVFVIYPYVQSMYVSFTQWRGLTPDLTWIGTANYERMLNDPGFWGALKNNIRYLVVIPIGTITISLGLAYLLTEGRVRFRSFYRVVYFFPWMMSIVAVGVLWGFIYSPRIGVLNGTLELLGIDKTIAWLGNPHTAWIAIAIVVIWQAVGFHMVLFIAGIGSIPQTYYEAAMIDGANRWHLFRYITLPLLRENVRTSFIFLAIGAFNMFPITKTMTDGNFDTEVLATYLYDKAFVSSQFGYASAIAVAIFLILIVFSIVTTFMSRGERLEY